MRSPYEDVTLLVEAGFWDDPRDPLMNAVSLLCMHAKARHKPVRNLHHLANAVAKGDVRAMQKYHGRLSDEVSRVLTKYPDIAGTLQTMAQMTNEDLEMIDRVMTGQVEPLAGPPAATWHENDVVAIIEIIEPLLTQMATGPDGEMVMYPEWAMRTWLKMELADVLGLLDDVAEHLAAGPNPGLDIGQLSPETHAEVESVYDAVFVAHEVSGLVGEVIRRVALGGDDAAAYARWKSES
jgi:hypothetical protein